ncbi:TauD/TfdA family dioxygenase [Pseudoduganella umbonata]|uniref:TauD/TfdA family dioxygenase n=1 Tax=Pseudoduganella umbonata TaxID=864828 RepID=A0ABX5UG26_9BURK|nr:TauD/TfdA family dioxygenase [Pseudoduganella umbonata]
MEKHVQTAKHTRQAGLVVLGEAGETLASIGKAQLAGWLGGHGYVVLRGFPCDVQGFSDLVRAHSSRISLDPARQFHGQNGNVLAQKVDAGSDAIGLHCENGNSPFWPDLCWFFCTQAPATGSQTTVCDGAAVYRDLSPGMRTALLAQDIVYTRSVGEALWKNYVRHASDAGPEPADTRTCFARLLALVDGSMHTQVELNADHSVTYSFRTPSILVRSRFSPGQPAFANSIFGPSFNYEHPRITFADGTPLPQAMRAALDEVCQRHTVDVGWRDDDIVVIDNARVMHGRRRIEDTRRTIYNALSYC